MFVKLVISRLHVGKPHVAKHRRQLIVVQRIDFQEEQSLGFQGTQGKAGYGPIEQQRVVVCSASILAMYGGLLMMIS